MVGLEENILPLGLMDIYTTQTLILNNQHKTKLSENTFTPLKQAILMLNPPLFSKTVTLAAFRKDSEIN